MGANTKIQWTANYNSDGTITPGYTWNPWTLFAYDDDDYCTPLAE